MDQHNDHESSSSEIEEALLQRANDLEAWCPASGEDVGEVEYIWGSDDWYVTCPMCEARWAGGRTVLSDHNRPWPSRPPHRSESDRAGSQDKALHSLSEGSRLLGHNVQAALISRGWVVADPNPSGDTTVEFFWPPTAPAGYRGPSDDPGSTLTGPGVPGPTPWVKPTRITQVGAGWHVAYGEAIAQAPDDPVSHADDQSLLKDLSHIEWWPMTVEEARTLQNERILHTIYADAYNQHSLGFFIKTEPYVSRLQEVNDRILRTTPIAEQDADQVRWAGDLSARMRILDGEMWASAVRTARAGGKGWDTSGRRDTGGAR